jgi:hypothetical protein
MTNTAIFSRRAAFAGVAAAAAIPAAASATSGQTAIGKLWVEAEALKARINGFRAEISAQAAQGGIPGWMRIGGEANKLGEARYQHLVAILNAKAERESDLVIIAKVLRDEDMQNGAKAYAADRLASATVEVLSRAA